MLKREGPGNVKIFIFIFFGVISQIFFFPLQPESHQQRWTTIKK